jgi:rifampin ADP-ribosylating transferase
MTTRHPIELAPYLASSAYIDPSDSKVKELIEARGWRRLGEVEAARRAFELVRDEVAHSWDVRSHRVTRTSVEALQHREGLCYSKAMLLAALLRALDVPAGLAYQRLLFGDTPAEGYCMHGLTTAFLSGRWIRIDARGNKPGVDAQFSLDTERLAFPVRPELGESELSDNFSAPPASLVAALDAHEDLHALIKVLPDRQDAGPFFHGTKANLSVGDMLEPGFSSNYGERQLARFIYLSATMDAAIWGAELAVGEGRGHIYQVEPTGAFEDDPNLTDKKFPGNVTRSYRTREPLRVICEVTDWQGHPAEAIQKMLDALAELKRRGVEAIND